MKRCENHGNGETVVGYCAITRFGITKLITEMKFGESKRYMYKGTTMLIMFEQYKNRSREMGEYRDA